MCKSISNDAPVRLTDHPNNDTRSEHLRRGNLVTAGALMPRDLSSRKLMDPSIIESIPNPTTARASGLLVDQSRSEIRQKSGSRTKSASKNKLSYSIVNNTTSDAA